MARRNRNAVLYNPPPLYIRIPVPVSLRVRTVSYPYPSQQQRLRRTIVKPLTPLREPYRMRTIKVRSPRTLPVVAGSYVTVRPHRLTIHSKRQTKNLLEREYNRRRYSERKDRRRMARNGQLDSLRSDPYGLVAEAARRGLSPERIADAALVARSLRRY